MARCLAAQVVESLPALDRHMVRRWLESADDVCAVSAQELTDALQADGHTVGVHTLRRHKAGTCSCHGPRAR